MNATAALIDECSASGITLSIKADKLSVVSPSPLTEDLKLRLVAGKSQLMAKLRWQYFEDLVVTQGCTLDEVNPLFSETDKTDLLEEPADQLPLHAQTIVVYLKRQRLPGQFEKHSKIRVETQQLKTCGSCKHFRYIDHAHLGNCLAKEPEGIAGNWDSDPRDHCESHQVNEAK